VEFFSAVISILTAMQSTGAASSHPAAIAFHPRFPAPPARPVQQLDIMVEL